MKASLCFGNCLGYLRNMEAGSVDVVVTSPPYNIGKAYGKAYDDSQRREMFKAFCADFILQVRLVLKEEGSFFLNVGSCPSNPMLPYQLATMCEQVFRLQNVFHWIKSISVPAGSGIAGDIRSLGHFKPINSKRYVTDCHEFVFHFTKTGAVQIDRLAIGVPYADKSNVKRWGHTGGRDVRCRGNVWFLPYDTIQKKRAHPAPFPLKLVENCIKLHGVERAKIVCDPFMGCGTSGVAAKKLGCEHFIGMEIEPDYFRAAQQAIEGKK
jgi:site-specific DNA-methyltransferase (adenine-specific)